MLSNRCFIHWIGNGYNTTTCNEVAHMFKGCETAAVVEQYARAVCSRNGWDAGLITPYALVRGLGESPFHKVGCGVSLT
jgi:hypothetical protein